MQRDWRAYLNDIIEASEVIESATAGIDLAGYRVNRLVRSAVEREFIMMALFEDSSEFWEKLGRGNDMVHRC
jgi:hypothetical protein